MSYQNLSYDYVAAFFLVMLLVWYFTEKKVPLKSYRYYGFALCTLLCSTIFEIQWHNMSYSDTKFSEWLIYAVSTLHSYCMHSFVVCLACCIVSMAHINMNKNKWIRNIFVIQWAMIGAVCLPNIFLSWAYSLEGVKLSMKPVGMVLYVIDFMMVALIAWVLIVKKQNYKFLRKSIVLFLFLCVVVAWMAQELDLAPMLNLAMTVFCMVLYLFQQGPEVDIDKVTQQFSRMFLSTYLKDKYIEEAPFFVVVVDLDDFKFINQHYGVAAGDMLLKQVGAYLDCGKGIHVFHFAADQFCVMVDRDAMPVKKVADGIVKRFSQPWYQDNIEINLSATVCIINCPKDAKDAESLIEVIDYSMDVAKSIRRGGITYASDVDLDKLQKTKAVEKVVKEAIAKGTIEVYYQPIFSIEKGCFNSAEALARLYDEKLGWIPPDEFITIAEKSGLIVELGELVLRKVCRFIRDNELSKTGIEYIEINVSAIQLMQRGYSERMLSIMQEYGVKPEQINVEITETAMMNLFSVVSDNLKELVNNNIAISLDDYGSGYASIEYINRMPFKFIKVDKSFVQSSFVERKANITLKYTISMLKDLDMSIIAEGVENEEMKEELIRFGCHYLQGWYYSKAVPGDEFMRKIRG